MPIRYAVVVALVLSAAACSEKPQESKAVNIPMKPVPVAEAPAAKPTPAAVPTEVAKPDPDKELAANIKKALDADSRLKDEPIEVTATAHVAHLWGTVSNAGTKKRAERIASSVPGVKSVDDQLAIVKGS